MLSLYLFELRSPCFVILLLFLQEKEVYLGRQLYMNCIHLLFLGSYPALLGKKKSRITVSSQKYYFNSMQQDGLCFFYVVGPWG